MPRGSDYYGGGVRLIDLSHRIDSGMPTYKGLPAPLICDYLTREASRRLYAAGTEFHIGRIDMVANTGTYLDSPFHRYEDGRDVSQLPLEIIAGRECPVAHIARPPARAIEVLPFTVSEVRGRVVLIHTDWARHWRTES